MLKNTAHNKEALHEIIKAYYMGKTISFIVDTIKPGRVGNTYIISEYNDVSILEMDAKDGSMTVCKGDFKQDIDLTMATDISIITEDAPYNEDGVSKLYVEFENKCVKDRPNPM